MPGEEPIEEQKEKDAYGFADSNALEYEDKMSLNLDSNSDQIFETFNFPQYNLISSNDLSKDPKFNMASEIQKYKSLKKTWDSFKNSKQGNLFLYPCFYKLEFNKVLLRLSVKWRHCKEDLFE